MYSATYLEQLQKSSPEAMLVIEKLRVASGKSLSLAEEFFLGSFLFVDRTDDGELPSLHNNSKVENYLFHLLYLIHHQNLNGERHSYNHLGKIPQQITNKDTIFLEAQYQQWQAIIENKKHTDSLLQQLTPEAKRQIAKSVEYAQRSQLGGRMKQYQKKMVTLHSKYLYLKVKKYFQELGAKQLSFSMCGHEVVIDPLAHYHILFRHYAKQATPYQFDSDYHANEDINPDKLPTELQAILTEYAQTVPCNSFDGQKIYVEMKGQIYAIRFGTSFRQVKGGKQSFLRLQTFFPLTKLESLQQISLLTKVVAPSGNAFFYQPMII